MARTTQQSAPAVDRDQIANELTQQLLGALNSPKSGVSLTDRLLQYTSDLVADSGNGIAELSAGFTAAADNFRISRESAKMRQQARTAEKVAQLVEHQLALKGL